MISNALSSPHVWQHTVKYTVLDSSVSLSSVKVIKCSLQNRMEGIEGRMKWIWITRYVWCSQSEVKVKAIIFHNMSFLCLHVFLVQLLTRYFVTIAPLCVVMQLLVVVPMIWYCSLLGRTITCFPLLKACIAPSGTLQASPQEDACKS